MSRQTQTVSQDALLGALATLLGGKMPRKSRSDRGFTKQAVADALSIDEKRATLDKATIAAFTKAGYADCQPRVNILTYGKEATADKPATGWIAKGRRVKKGEKSIHVKAVGMKGRGIPLFHVSQTEEISAAVEQAAEQAANED